MAAIGEPLGLGIVANLAQPGGNVTGLSAFVTALSGKRIELLREMLPGMQRIAVLLNMENPLARCSGRDCSQGPGRVARVQRQS